MKAFLYAPKSIREEIMNTIESVDFSFSSSDTSLRKAIELAEAEGVDYFIIYDEPIGETMLFDALGFYPANMREMTIIFIASPERAKPSAFYDKLILVHGVTQVIAPDPEDELDWIFDLAHAIHHPIPQKDVLMLSAHVVEKLREKVAAKKMQGEKKTEKIEQSKAASAEMNAVSKKSANVGKVEVGKEAKAKAFEKETSVEKQDVISKREGAVSAETAKRDERWEENGSKKSEAFERSVASGEDIDRERQEKKESSEAQEEKVYPREVRAKAPSPVSFSANRGSALTSFGAARFIAIAQVRPREGSTHLAFALARTLCLSEQKVAVVVPTSTYSELRRTYGRSNRFVMDEEAQMIDFAGIHYYRNTDGYGSLQVQNYDFIIADLGLAEFYFDEQRSKVSDREYMMLAKTWNRAEVRIISSFISPTGHWYAGSDFLNSGTINKKEISTIKWAVFGINHPQIANAVNVHLKKHMPTTSKAKAVEIPFIPLPLFMKSEEVPYQLYELVDSVIDARRKEFSGPFNAVPVEQNGAGLRETGGFEETRGALGLFGKLFGGKR